MTEREKQLCFILALLVAVLVWFNAASVMQALGFILVGIIAIAVIIVAFPMIIVGLAAGVAYVACFLVFITILMLIS